MLVQAAHPGLAGLCRGCVRWPHRAKGLGTLGNPAGKPLPRLECGPALLDKQREAAATSRAWRCRPRGSGQRRGWAYQDLGLLTGALGLLLAEQLSCRHHQGQWRERCPLLGSHGTWTCGVWCCASLAAGAAWGPEPGISGRPLTRSGTAWCQHFESRDRALDMTRLAAAGCTTLQRSQEGMQVQRGSTSLFLR